jgi:transcriptional regulator with XRE-family HTH domain
MQARQPEGVEVPLRTPNAPAVARFRSGLTQERLAAKAGVAVNTVQRIEAGELPTLRIALKIAHALDEDVSLFVVDREEERVRA